MIQVGTVIQVIGPVVDVEFTGGELPPIYGALKISNPRIDDRDENLVVEVAQHLGDEIVRCVRSKNPAPAASPPGPSCRATAPAPRLTCRYCRGGS